VGTSIQEQVVIQQVISSRKYSWYNKITVGDWWSRTQGEGQDVSRYNVVMIINQKSDLKPDESILDKAHTDT